MVTDGSYACEHSIRHKHKARLSSYYVDTCHWCRIMCQLGFNQEHFSVANKGRSYWVTEELLKSKVLVPLYFTESFNDGTILLSCFLSFGLALWGCDDADGDVEISAPLTSWYWLGEYFITTKVWVPGICFHWTPKHFLTSKTEREPRGDFAISRYQMKIRVKSVEMRRNISPQGHTYCKCLHRIQCRVGLAINSNWRTQVECFLRSSHLAKHWKVKW